MLREVKESAKGHTAWEWQREEMSSRLWCYERGGRAHKMPSSVLAHSTQLISINYYFCLVVVVVIIKARLEPTSPGFREGSSQHAAQ